MNTTTKRPRRASKGRWMKLKDPNVLIAFMDKGDFSQARLGRYAGVSRQFIHQLVTGEKRTCSDKTGRLIEEAFKVPEGTLFMLCASPAGRPSVNQSKMKVAA